MKRTFITRTLGMLLSLLLLMGAVSLATLSVAAAEAVAYTADSVFDAGGTVTVDITKTRQNIMDLGKNSDEYNAALEGQLQYYWYRNDSYYLDGPTVELEEKDRGCQFFCRVFLFSDADRTQQCGVYDSAVFSVPNDIGEEYTLEVMQEPTKMTYTLGETVDLTGLWVRIYTPDGYIDSRDGDKLTYFQDELLTAGDRKIKLSYGEAFTFLYVTVKAPTETVVQLLQAPKKVEYVAGETLDLTGLKVRVITTDGTCFESENGDKLTVTTNPLTTPGEQKIKVKYGDAFDIFIVTVKQAPATTPTAQPTDPTAQPTVQPTDPTTAPTATVPGGDDPGDAPAGADVGTDPDPDGETPEGMPWWGIVLIAVAAAGVGAAVVILVVKSKKS